jgi:hypothetical protein
LQSNNGGRHNHSTPSPIAIAIVIDKQQKRCSCSGGVQQETSSAHQLQKNRKKQHSKVQKKCNTAGDQMFV